MKIKIPVALGISLMALSTAKVDAALLAQWTFETSLPVADATDYVAEGGLYSTTSIARSSTGGTISNPVGNGSIDSFSSNGWDAGDYFQFRTSTLGQQGITFSFDQVSSGTGPGDFAVLYSVNGTDFVQASTYDVYQNSNVGTNDVSFGTWGSSTPVTQTSYTFDFTSVTALNNQANVYFRLQAVGTATPSGGTVAATGTSRVDNVAVNSVPEPSSLMISGLGALVVLRRRR